MTDAIRNQLAGLSHDQRAALAESLRARRPSEPTDHDVVILGGGTAGLTLALHLRQVQQGIRVLVVEKLQHPVPETTHKVGESTVEIAAHYLRDVLGLEDHLEKQQIRKFGLRMFFSNHDNTDIADRVELGSSVFPPLGTYQLDRGRLENELGVRCVDAGVDFLDGCKVVDVELRADSVHRVRVEGPDRVRDITARWVVDASGRSQLLHRHNAGRREEVGHAANAAWFRVAHEIDVGTWTEDAEWAGRILEGDRALSTNHLMGDGYWVWLIRLASGSTSVGIVADADVHPFAGFNTLDKALDWLRQREPQCAAVVDEHVDGIQDFRVMRDYSYSCDQVFSGQQRWCLTGESGVFLDPLYSPGLDLIAIGNTLVVDLVTRSLAGEDVTALGAIHDSLFRGVASIWLAVYEKQYRLMGNAQVMSSKVIWDTAFYWGVFGLLFFQDMFRSAATVPSIAANLGRLTQISNRVQQFFREWESIDDSDLGPQFVDLYAPLNFMVKLHAGMADELTATEFETRFSENTRLFAQLAGQLVSTVIAAFAERTGDDVIARIQDWQRDPLIADLLAIYRRERHRNPTSTGWMTVTKPVPAANPA
ncbi:halogenase [Lentzea aerocolonigenes]|uniref:Halogenase n=1 Tax=Lentzea aerocolonigenes TaxID=68170 RepID=A0A0F0GQ45_LENAE|nr:tryptophan 7-halogenase [Lentzea aerocolonigenes]KJK43543.1 halogenase [Lentzea aerocolonigenes]